MNFHNFLRHLSSKSLSLALAAWQLSLSCTASVQWQPITKRRIVESVYGVGMVESSQVFQLNVGVVTTIEAIHVSEGEQVKKGQELLRLSYPIVAPFAGTITSLPFHEGENVSPGVPIVTLMDLNDRYLNVALVQRGALRVRAGQTARIGFEELPQQVFLGRVKSIFPFNDSFNARIEVDALPANVLPGMTADVAIEVAPEREGLVVPLKAVRSGQIILKDHETERSVAVELGYVGSNFVEVIASELQEGQMVRVEP